MLQQHLENLLATNYRLISLTTDSVEQSVNDFQPLVRESKAIYVWTEQTGLRRIEVSHIDIPKTETPERVLNYIAQSQLYGIYLLVGFNKELTKYTVLTTLLNIAKEQHINKTIILIDNHFNYPQALLAHILTTRETDIA